MKRFYRDVAVTEGVGGHGLALDGKPVRTPAKRPFTVPSRALAEGIAGEWRAQREEVRPASMPLMQLAGTAIDLVSERRHEVATQTAKYAETDLLCYRAVEPAELAVRQEEAWQPELDWARTMFDAPLVVTSGIIPVTQSSLSLAALHAVLGRLELFTLTAVSALTAVSGSLVLALGVLHGRLTGEAACALALLDETYQVERWGEDDEAALRRAGLKCHIGADAAFLSLLRAGTA